MRRLREKWPQWAFVVIAARYPELGATAIFFAATLLGALRS
jgi:hypothetical protein